MNKIFLLINNIKYAIVELFQKKDPEIVVIDSWFGQKFADNSRYLYQYLFANKEKLGLKHVVWVTRDEKINYELNSMGYECYMLNSKESVHYHKKAYYHICNNAPVDSGVCKGELLGKYSFRSRRINLWHGTGVIKTFNMASNEYKQKVERHPFLYKVKNVIYSYCSVYRKIFDCIGGWGDCYFLTTSESECEKFRKCYPLPYKKFIISNYPRNSSCIKLLKKEEEIVGLLKMFKTSILYLPTFRSSESKFNYTLVAESMKKTLKEKNILFIQKSHSADKMKSDEYSFEDNILNLGSNFDINILTPLVTFVMTDYSSILADALYHYKPIILYVPDYSEYMNSDRGFSVDAEYLLSAGKKFFDLNSLNKFIEENYNTPNNGKTDNYNDIRLKIWGNENKKIDQIWNDIVAQTK